MRAFRALGWAGAALGLTLSSLACFAGPDASVRNSVAVCDPYNPQNCDAPGSTGVSSAQITVGTSATLLSATRVGRSSVTLTNTGTATVFIGPAGVTATTGLALLANASITLKTQGALYGVVATATQVVGVLETY